MQSSLIFLLLIGPLAATANADDQSITPCDAVATHVRSVAADPKIVDRPKGQDFDDYDALLAPIVSFTQPELADGALWAKATQLLGGDQNAVVEVQHLDGPVWRAVQVAGTAHCEIEHFFSVGPDRDLSTVDTPAAFGELCWNNSRRIGRVNGRPALIEQEVLEHPLLGVDVEITPWTNGDRATCQVAIRFNDAFRVTERFCEDPSLCIAAAPLAPKLAEALARADDGTTLATVSQPSPQQAQALAARLFKARESFGSPPRGYTELPTFGAKPRTKYSTYAGTPQVTLIALAGRTLMGRIGMGGIGWRELGDYLITLYRIDGDGLDPVASFVVERKNTGLRSVRISVPQSHGNAR